MSWMQITKSSIGINNTSYVPFLFLIGCDVIIVINQSETRTVHKIINSYTTTKDPADILT